MTGEQTANRKSSAKNKCGPGQPPKPHRSWNSHLAFAPPGAATKRSVPVRQHSLGAPLLPVQAAEPRFGESLFPILCDCRQPNPLKEQDVEEAAMPGLPTRAYAHFRFPPAIHPRELPAATGVTAIIVRQALRVPTFSLNPLCARRLRIATEKHSPVVQKLWTRRLPCGSLRKNKNELLLRDIPSTANSITYTLVKKCSHPK